MSLFNTIKAQQLSARKIRDTVTASLLTTIIGEFQRRQSKDDPTDDQVFNYLQTMQDNIRDIQAKSKVTEQSTKEIEILHSLLLMKPVVVSASDDDVREAAQLYATSNPTSDIRDIMTNLKEKFGAAFDGKKAIAIVKSIINS